MNKCKTCKFREGIKCKCTKIRTDYLENQFVFEDCDELQYIIVSYDECGGFRVGENFGCVHWEGKQ